tara:strand:+ start:72 stop:377 length:306 start_codon:yes stop_codon:yes gene_type:complete
MARGVQLSEARQVRVFAHDAINLTPSGVLDTATINASEDVGVCLYVGQGADITVTLESRNSVTFKGVAAGSFLPILVTAVTAYTLTDGTATKADNDILALY